MLTVPEIAIRSCRFHVRRTVARFTRHRDRWLDPSGFAFYTRMRDAGFDADTYIDVLPRHRLIYVCVPKSASTTIRFVLSALENDPPPPPDLLYKRRCSGLKSPSLVGISAFHRLATSADTLRFSFVRNPYARLVSAWANKFKDKPLVPGDAYIDLYRQVRADISRSLPEGPDQTLSFAQFVAFAAATATAGIDPHWEPQGQRLTVPGVAVDLIGKVERFDRDFKPVLNHVGAGDRFGGVIAQLNRSMHKPWSAYYTPELAALAYRAYECDFDRFGYVRAPEAPRAET